MEDLQHIALLVLTYKHLIVPTQYYDPEIFQVNHLVSLFLANDWYVTVIAPFPSYPSVFALKGRSSPILRHDRLNICRFPVFKRDGSLFLAAINSFLFVIFGSFLTLYFSLKHPRAQIFAVQYSPFTCIIPAVVSAFLLNKKASLWVFDLWPQSISTLLAGSTVSRFLYSVIGGFVPFIYSSFSNFYVSSPSFMLLHPFKSLENISLLCSWESNVVPPRFGRENNISSPVRLISIGNLGVAHDLYLLERFLLYTRHRDFTWSFVGGGSGMSRLQSFCSLHELNNVLFHGFLPKNECLRLCSNADLSIVPFRDSEISDTICYRFVSSLSVATPVISFGDNCVSGFISSYECGFTLKNYDNLYPRPEDSSSADSLSSLVSTITSRLSFIRSSARDSAFDCFMSNFSQSAAENVLKEFFVNV